MTPKKGDTIAVWVSCGAASAAAAIMTKSRYGEVCSIRYVNNPIREEHTDNIRFMRDLEEYLDQEIETATNPNYPNASIFDVFEDRKFISSPYGAPCTGELKKKSRQEWEDKNHADWHVLGFTADEENRHKRFTLTERENVLPILIDAGMTKDDCGRMMNAIGLKMPMAYELGMPNANCMGCVKATSATYWNLIRDIAPENFERLSEISRRLGVKLVRWNKQRMFLDELPKHARGNDLKTMNLECGLFCEEKWK